MPGLKRAKHFFKKSDFEGNRCMVVMRNITTSTDLPKGQRPELTEVSKGQLVLLIPEGSCAEGHLLLLRFFEEAAYLKVKNSPRSVQDKAQLLAVTGRVDKIESAPGKMTLATVELKQYVEKEWQALLKSLTDSQEKVSALVKRVKQ